MRMKEFKQSVIESLGHYVYCLVDPRDNRIFYIGEGCGNRVFNHAYDALNDNLQSLKLDVIRDIISQGMEVKYYIIRHGMTQDVAFLVESVLIDLLTYEPFNLESILTNIQSGHHQWDRGIKTVEEINSITRDDLFAFHKRFIGPEDMIISVSGGIPAGSAVSGEIFSWVVPVLFPL